MKPPREFWIEKSSLGIFNAVEDKTKLNGWTHDNGPIFAIETSPEIIAATRGLMKALEEIIKVTGTSTLQNKIAREALAKIKSEDK